MGEKRNACGILVGKPEGRRPLGGPRRIRNDNNKMDLKRDGMKWRELESSGSG
jgi:hypothetical protein